MNTVLENPTETTWLADRRAAGKTQFETLPAPSVKDERWRFARVTTLSIDGFAPATAPSAETLATLAERSNLVSERAGQLVFADDAQAQFEGISDELAAQGVIYLPVAEAIAKHPELMEKYFLQESTELGSEKFFGLPRSSRPARSSSSPRVSKSKSPSSITTGPVVPAPPSSRTRS